MDQCSYCGKADVPGHFGNCIVRKALINQKVTKEYLAAGISGGLSMSMIQRQIAADFDLTMNIGSLINRARRLGLKTPGFLESANLPSVRQQCAATCLAAHGTENVGGSPQIIAKRKASVRAKYGVDNVFQLQAVKEKSIATNMRKHGVSYTLQRSDIKRSTGKLSVVHASLSRELLARGILHENEAAGRFRGPNEFLGGAFSPVVDILLTDYPIVIEVYGDLWHANPDRFEADDLIKTWGGPKTARQIWAHDLLRECHIESFGYAVVTVWISEIQSSGKRRRWLDQFQAEYLSG